MEGSELVRLGQNIRHHRMVRHLSQEELANLSGLHRTYVGGIERGERNVTVLNLVRLAKALEISVSDLMRNVD